VGKVLKVGVVVVLLAGVGVCAWSLVRTVTPETVPKAVLSWKCSKCDAVFEAEPTDDPNAAFSETQALPSRPCPKCGGTAYRLLRMRCTACKAEFDLYNAPDPDTGRAPELVCPKCGDERVATIRALEKK